MNTKTGNIIAEDKLNTLSPEEKKDYTPLTPEELKTLMPLEPKQRVKTLNDIRHTQKQIAKRRAANKRNKQSRKNK